MKICQVPLAESVQQFLSPHQEEGQLIQEQVPVQCEPAACNKSEKQDKHSENIILIFFYIIIKCEMGLPRYNPKQNPDHI